MLPFKLEEVKINEKWRPDICKKYLIEYQWNKPDDPPHYIIGSFSSTWFGYTFHWFWAASSLQLSTRPQSNDWKRFKRVWEFKENKMTHSLTKKIDHIGNIDL
jgi:hypothetical protein